MSKTTVVALEPPFRPGDWLVKGRRVVFAPRLNRTLILTILQRSSPERSRSMYRTSMNSPSILYPVPTRSPLEQRAFDPARKPHNEPEQQGYVRRDPEARKGGVFEKDIIVSLLSCDTIGGALLPG